MKLQNPVLAATAAAALVFSGCKTPPEVKQALASLDVLNATVKLGEMALQIAAKVAA